MTGKRCPDCKHTKGIGYDFWCGAGHTEYEVFGAETNCPYYEYHDWSKGVPSMTAKRFTYMIDRVFDLWGVYDNKEKVICLVRNTDAKDLCDLLNALHEENQRLREIISANRTITIPYTITDEKLVKELREMFKEDLDD